MKYLVCVLIQAVLALSLSAADKQPNILFIFSDDHALQAIGAYGSKINQTPNIDRIADEGMIFQNSFCANSICGPSRANILTGKHSHINGFRRNGNRFDGSQWTFPKEMQKAGYETAIIGKWHLGTDPVGFNYWEVLPGQGNYYNPDLLQMDGKRKRYTGYCTDIITELSLEWLKKGRNQDKPFVLMAQHKAPHRNWSPHPRHFGRYKLGTTPEPDTLFDDYSGRSQLLKENEMTLEKHFHWGHDTKLHGPNQYPEFFAGRHANREYSRMTPEQKADWDKYYQPENDALLAKLKAGEITQDEVTQWKYQRYMHDYLGCIQAVDDGVGELLKYLDDTGLAENTIVIYSSDQGFYLGEHGWYDKRWMFEESLRMPFIIRWPGTIQAGVESKALIQNIDYAPTFLQVAGLTAPAAVQGRSILPVLLNGGKPTADWRDAIYYSYYENASVHMVPQHDGVRTDRYKAFFLPRSREWQLFDLEEDPQEMISVHQDPKYANVLSALQQRHNDLKKFYDMNFAAVPATRGDEAWWKKRDQEKRAQAKKGGHDLVFIGDSITQGWEGRGKDVWEEFYGDRKALNLGFSGDRTEHVIWRLTYNQMGPNKPKAAVVMIGTNNTGHSMQDPEEVAEGVDHILELLEQKSPDTKVLLLCVFPRGQGEFDEKRQNNLGINQRIRRLADGERVHYLDISDVFLEEDRSLSKEIMPDYLHLSEEGYQRWAKAMEPSLKELGL